MLLSIVRKSTYKLTHSSSNQTFQLLLTANKCLESNYRLYSSSSLTNINKPFILAAVMTNKLHTTTLLPSIHLPCNATSSLSINNNNNNANNAKINPHILTKQNTNVPQLVVQTKSLKTTSSNTIYITTQSNQSNQDTSNSNNVDTLLTSNNNYSVWQTPMASLQSLSISPTRESIELIRRQFRDKNAKHNDDQQISVDKDLISKIATITFKSGAKNAISAKMMCDFTDVLDELYEWKDGKGVLICGHNNFFCSGGDLVSVRELANYEGGHKMATLMQYNMSRLQALPMITMALIEGKALGGGAEIASTVDLRVMASSAKIGYVHVRVGICSAWGGGSRLVQLVGPSRAIELMASGRLVGANEALSMGLANFIIDDHDNNITTTHSSTNSASINNNNNIETNNNVAELSKQQTNTTNNKLPPLEVAKQYLAEHLIGAKSTIMAIKALVNAARTLPLERALVAESQILSSTWGKAPHIEALNSNVKHKS